MQGAHIFIPFAAAAILHREGLVNLCLPFMFNESMRQNLKLNPLMVNIKSMHPFYFELGMKLANVYVSDFHRQGM